MAELVDALDSKSSAERRGGSIPSWGTKAEFFISFEDFRFFISFQIIVHQVLPDGSLTPAVVLVQETLRSF